MGRGIDRNFFEECWKACYLRALRPVEGVLLEPATAARLAESVMLKLIKEHGAFLRSAAFSAESLETSRDRSKTLTADERKEKDDHQVFHDPEDHRYPKNLNLDELQSYDSEGHFKSTEWNALPDLLMPLASTTLARKGIKNPDAEEIIFETLAELTRERASGKRPIELPTVFEELIPLFLKMVFHRGVDHLRRHHSLKNRANVQDSLEGLREERGYDLPLADSREHELGSNSPVTFEGIYAQCREELTPAEWDLIFELYVARSTSISDLINRSDLLARLKIDPDASPSTIRRRLNDFVTHALDKLAAALE